MAHDERLISQRAFTRLVRQARIAKQEALRLMARVEHQSALIIALPDERERVAYWLSLDPETTAWALEETKIAGEDHGHYPG